MRRLFRGALAALALLCCAPAQAADRKPLVIGPTGQNQQIQPGDGLLLQPATTGNASIILPPGTAPTSPADGSVWFTTAGMYIRVAGSTIGPLSAGGSPGGSSGQLQYNNAGAFGGVPTVNGDGTLSTSTGVLNVTKLNGVSPGYFFSGTDAANLTGTAACARFPALTGDVTTSAGSCATTAATVNSNVGSFTNANITVNAKGLITAAASGSGGSGTVTTTGSPASGNLAKFSGSTSITNTTVSAFLDSELSSTQGAVAYRGASAWAALSPGTSGQVLQANGAAANPSWVTPSGGSVGAGAEVLLATITPGAVNSITLVSGLASTYSHIKIVATLRTTAAVATTTAQITFNGDSNTTHYINERVYAALNSALGSQGLSDGFIYAADATGANVAASWPSSFELIVPYYAGTAFFKTAIGNSFAANGTGSGNFFRFGHGSVWKDTSAITQIDLTLGSGNFVAGSTIKVYGVY